MTRDQFKRCITGEREYWFMDYYRCRDKQAYRRRARKRLKALDRREAE